MSDPNVMFFSLDTVRPSYALFHKLALCFLKLAGLDPNMNLGSQFKSEPHHCHWAMKARRLMKVFSWMYSLSILAVLLVTLVENVRYSISSTTLDKKINVVLLIWYTSYGGQSFLLPLVFMVKSRRISKMNSVLIRWIKTYFNRKKLSLMRVLVWIFYFVSTLTNLHNTKT